MYIGKLALVTGVTQKAIRHYENLGLIPAPERKGKYRFYKQLDKLTKITKHAKRHFWLNDVCTCHGLLPSHSA